MRGYRTLVCAAVLLGPVAALADGISIPMPSDGAASAVSPRSLALTAGSGRLLNLPAAAANVFVADPKVLQVRPASATALFVFGTAPGATTIAAMAADGHPVAQYSVTVRPSAFDAGEAAGAIERELPGADIHVADTASGLVLTGRVTSPSASDEAARIAAAYLDGKQTLDNQLAVTGATEVLLQVRIAQMSRQVTRQLGVNWQSVGAIVGSHLPNPLSGGGVPAAQFAVAYFNPGLDVAAIIDALAQDNLARVLAEPNLTAISGQAANFLSGGEFPIPISQSLGTTNVEYKDYGVSLSFIPTVLSDSRISLRVRPEVSQLTTVGAVTVQSGGSTLTIPALTVSRADTTVELGSGQTFAIAGLLQDQTTQNSTSVPVIGDLPYIGGLFRSNTTLHQQEELVFLVTPYIVKPQSDPSVLKTPGDAYAKPPNDFERLILLRQTASTDTKSYAAPAPSEAGFLVQ